VKTARSGRQIGAVLLITLALLALITVVTVAYFSRTTTDRRIESASSGAVRADILARATAQLVLSDIKMEIVGGSTVTQPAGQMAIYSPASAQSAVPARVLATAGMLTTPTFNSLVKQSTGRFFPPGYTTTPAITVSTGRDTSVTSSNSRIVSAARWNAPALNTGTGFSNPVELPQWILMDRQGIAASQSWSTALRDYTSSNDQAVIGRFAFNVYDLGGLLDANVAGNPVFTTPLTAAQIQQLKSTQAGASLYDSAGPIIPGFDQTMQMNFVNKWKFGTGTTATNFFSDFMSRTIPPSTTVPPTMADAGFLRPTVAPNRATNQLTSGSDSNTFAYSRADIIRLIPPTTSPTGNYITASALPYFTHFSRELNAPSWMPATPAGSTTDYAAASQSVSSANRDVTNVRVRSAFLRQDGTQAVVGEPLIKNRFPLRRVDAIGSTGLNSAAFPVMLGGALQAPTAATTTSYTTGTTVQRDFGLVWNSANNRWDYVGPSGSSLQTSIATLDQIATAGREPNFFEILKAFILSGSLGLGTDNTGAGRTVVDAEARYYQQPGSGDAQIIQIGANIIDEWDADKNPLFIQFGSDEYAGVENVPYLNKLVYQPQWTSASAFGAWLLPSFWSSSQNGTAVGTQSATTPAIRFAMTAGTASGVVESSVSSATSTVVTALGGTPPSPSLQLVPTANFTTIPNTPSNASNPSAGVLPSAPNAKYGIPFVFTNTGAVTRANTTRTYPVLNNVTFEMQAQVGGATGPWKTYQKWMHCNVNAPSVTSVCQPGPVITGTQWGSASIYDPEYVVLDPRTMRFGTWETHGSATGDSTDFNRGSNETLDRDTGGFQAITGAGPNGATFAGVSGSFVAAQLANNAAVQPNYKDFDGVRRGGDALNSGDTSALRLANATDRSPVLSRQTRTVAELGTVFRDQPWKTLNFTAADSADCGLLDAFTIFEPNSVFRSDLVAGKISLNTRQPAVIRAVLNGVTKNTTDSTGTTLITASERDAIVDSLIAMTSAQPMINKSELVTRLAADPSITSLGAKEKREAVIRALSDVGQTRTWNLMIDVIAQVGKYGFTAASVDDFIVQGEKRYWFHVAIDRFTGEVIDQQLEAVYE
jgi:Tfp pilus assembly protein PilX